MIETEFIEYIVKQLVDRPDAVKVERAEDERGVLLNLMVDPDDLGRVIGKHGATAQSLRSLLRALGTKNNDHYNLKIIDTDESNDKTNSKADDDVSNTTETSQNSAAKPADVENSDSESSSETVEKADDDVSDRAKKLREDLAKYDDLDI